MKNLFFYVIAAHALIIAAVFYVHTPFAKKAPTAPALRTQTIVLNKIPKHELTEVKEPLPIEILSPPLENLLVSKKEATPKQVKPKEVKTGEKKKPVTLAKPKKEASKAAKKPVPPSPSDSRLEQVAALMRQSLEKLESPSKTSSKPSSKTPTPAKLSSLASESLSQEATYQHDLVAYLEDALEFPEKGKVRIKLSLKRDGGVQKLEIVEASSEKNKKFVETQIPELTFPPFGRNFGSEIVHTFSITLSSENSR